MQDTEVGADLQGDTDVLDFWDTRIMCVFDLCVVDTDADTYAGTQTHKLLTHHKRHNKGHYLGA